jgi:hypothetical protein
LSADKPEGEQVEGVAVVVVVVGEVGVVADRDKAEGLVGRPVKERGRIRTRRVGGTIIGRGDMTRRWPGLVVECPLRDSCNRLGNTSVEWWLQEYMLIDSVYL